VINEYVNRLGQRNYGCECSDRATRPVSVRCRFVGVVGFFVNLAMFTPNVLDESFAHGVPFGIVESWRKA